MQSRTITFEAYDYPAAAEVPLADWEGWGGGRSEFTREGGGAPAQSPGGNNGGGDSALPVEFEARLERETLRSFEAGRERGRLEGRAAELDGQAAAMEMDKRHFAERVTGLMEAFTEERDRYLRSVEHEVVKLALGVAARILRREAQMDPLLLTGAVRVALGQLASSTEVRLRVPEADLELWRQCVALLPNLAVKPQVIGGESMRLGDCVVETAMGSVDLGVRSQLSEIERGFFDRAQSISAHSAALAEAGERDH